MTYFANQRIKMGGVYYAVGDPIDLTEAEVAELPKGAVTIADEQNAPELSGELLDAQLASLLTAVERLQPGAFKQDGEIRAGALKHLNETLGFDVTVGAVATAKAAIEAVQE